MLQIKETIEKIEKNSPTREMAKEILKKQFEEVIELEQPPKKEAKQPPREEDKKGNRD